MDDTSKSAGESCYATEVIVQGKQAVWIFTEFQTDQSLDDLADWLKPDNWPSWGGAMFKEMTPVGPVTEVPSETGRIHTSADYLEVVNLAGQELQTMLNCEFKSAPTWAGMSYDLDRSIGDVLQVDRGYLVVIDAAGKRLVKALKVVGFTDTRLNSFATAVCPEWGEWVRRATSVAAATASQGYTDPTPGSVGDLDSNLSDPTGGAATGFTQGYAAEWAGTVAEQAKFYGEFAADVGDRMWSGKYGQQDAVEDSSRLFMRLARDWSKAWQTGLAAAERWAEADVPPTAGPGPAGSFGSSVEHTSLLVPPQERATAIAVTDLALVARSPRVLKAKDITVKPATVGPSEAAQFVTIQADTTGSACGLYEGELLVGGVDAGTVPAVFYVSRARRAQ